MTKILVLICFVFSTSAFAATPTPEGLFRNGANPDPAGDMMVLRFAVKEERFEEHLNKTKMSDSPDEINDAVADLEPERFIKLIISKKPDEKTKLLQIEYTEKGMARAAITKVSFIKDIDEWGKTANLEQALFYGVLYSLVTNESSLIANFLKRTNKNFETNEELINPEKLELMNKYKEYLALVKKSKEEKLPIEDIPHPYKSEDEEEQKKINEVKKMPFYKTAKTVKLKRKDDQFLWSLELENTYAEFGHRSFSYKNIEVLDQGTVTKMTFGEFLAYDGKRALPRYILYKTNNNKLYRIGMISSSSFENKKEIEARRDEYMKWFEQNAKKKKEAPLDQAQTDEITPVRKFIL